MRLFAAMVLALGACHGAKAPTTPTPVTAKPAPAPWDAIAALAVPTTPATGTSAALVHALELASSDEAGAVASLVEWSRASGPLPPPPSPLELGKMALLLRELGQAAVARSTSEDWEPLAAAAALAGRMIGEGATFYVVVAGIDLARQVRFHLKTLGDPQDSFPWPGPDELVRIVAAEAVHSRAQLAWSLTDEGKQAARDAYAAMTPEMQRFIGDPGGLTPDPATAAALEAFWVEALAGARRGEPAATTLARAQRAQQHTAAGKAQVWSGSIVGMIETISRGLSAP